MMSLYEIDSHVLEWMNLHRLRFLDGIFIWITDTAFWVALSISLIVLIYGFLRRNIILRWKGWQLLCAIIANSIVVNILKYTVNRERPFVHDKLIEKLSTGGSPSFPSGHTADAFVIATSMSLLFYTQWKLLFLIWAWAIAVGYSRIVLGVHYPSDVLASIIIASIVAIIINFYSEKRKANKRYNL